MSELAAGPRPPESPTIPSWDERLHVQVRRPITPATLVRLQREREDAPDPAIAQADRDYWRTRQRLIRQAQESGVPYWRQVATSVVTSLDNVQDVASTLAWLGGPLLRSLGRIGTILHGEAVAGVSAAGWLERTLGGPVPGRAGKHKYTQQRPANARTRTGLIGGLQRGMEWFGREHGHLLEAAQASDTLFGVGLTLGAIVGALEETYWRTGQQLYYTALSAANVAIAEFTGLSPAGQAAAREAAGNYARAGLEAPAAPPVEWAANMYRAMLVPERQRRLWAVAAQFAAPSSTSLDLGDQEGALLSLAGTGAAIVGGRAIAGILHVAPTIHLEDLIMPSARVQSEAARAALEMWGAPIGVDGVVGGEWGTPEQTLGEYTAEQLGRLEHTILPWLPADPAGERAQLLHQLVECGAPAAAVALTGSEDGLHDLYTPAEQRLFAVLEHSAVPGSAPR